MSANRLFWAGLGASLTVLATAASAASAASLGAGRRVADTPLSVPSASQVEAMAKKFKPKPVKLDPGTVSKVMRAARLDVEPDSLNLEVKVTKDKMLTVNGLARLGVQMNNVYNTLVLGGDSRDPEHIWFVRVEPGVTSYVSLQMQSVKFPSGRKLVQCEFDVWEGYREIETRVAGDDAWIPLRTDGPSYASQPGESKRVTLSTIVSGPGRRLFSGFEFRTPGSKYAEIVFRECSVSAAG